MRAERPESILVWKHTGHKKDVKTLDEQYWLNKFLNQ